MTLNSNSRLKRNPDIISADMKGETVMMSITTGKYHSVNPIGAKIWEMIHEPTSVNQIVIQLTEEYEIDAETCEKEVIAFLNDSMVADLIQLE